MILENGGTKYYVDRTVIEGFLGEPELFIVPGSGDEIAGLSMYRGRPVLYYELSGAQSRPIAEDILPAVGEAVLPKAAAKPAGDGAAPPKAAAKPEQMGRCGVILRGDGRWLCGITGVVSGEASVPEAELIPVHPGVWELQNDSIK